MDCVFIIIDETRTTGNIYIGSGLKKLNLGVQTILLFITRVQRELKRVYINGCRYNERLNTETEGSKTPRIHWVAWVNIQ
jgi:hypothetical protein